MAMTRTFTALVVLLATSGASAQSSTDRPAWLPPGSDLRAALADRPREILRPGSGSFNVRLGRLLFRSPSLLGTKAREIGLSCDSCHTNGGANTTFFIPAVSDRPGNVDATHRFWSPRADDGRDNPVNIPSLRGVRLTAPYGHDGRFASLREFVRHVIVGEFAGPEPSPGTLDALEAYLHALALPANETPEPGAALFERACAGCHVPSAGFIDRLSHDVGSGGRFDTPTLLGIAGTAPYFHDGRYADLDAVVRHFETALGLDYTDAERAGLVAHLEAIGTAPGSHGPISLTEDLTQLTAAVGLLSDTLNDEDFALTARIALLLRGEVGVIHGRFNGPGHEDARDTLTDWARRLRVLGQAAGDRNLIETRETIADLRRAMAAGRAAIERAMPDSLYDVSSMKNQ